MARFFYIEIVYQSSEGITAFVLVYTPNHTTRSYARRCTI